MATEMATEQITEGETAQTTASDTEQIIAAANGLPLAGRVRVLEAIAASIRDGATPTANGPQNAMPPENGTPPAPASPAADHDDESIA